MALITLVVLALALGADLGASVLREEHEEAAPPKTPPKPSPPRRTAPPPPRKRLEDLSFCRAGAKVHQFKADGKGSKCSAVGATAEPTCSYHDDGFTAHIKVEEYCYHRSESGTKGQGERCCCVHTQAGADDESSAAPFEIRKGMFGKRRKYVRERWSGESACAIPRTTCDTPAGGRSMQTLSKILNRMLATVGDKDPVPVRLAALAEWCPEARSWSPATRGGVVLRPDGQSVFAETWHSCRLCVQVCTAQRAKEKLCIPRGPKPKVEDGCPGIQELERGVDGQGDLWLHWEVSDPDQLRMSLGDEWQVVRPIGAYRHRKDPSRVLLDPPLAASADGYEWLKVAENDPRHQTPPPLHPSWEVVPQDGSEIPYA